jgi:predicted dehydrogenase
MKTDIGILGLGHIGNYHVQALQYLSEFRLTAACDLNPDLCSIIPENVTFYQDYHDFLADTSFNTVIIATPNNTHYSLGCAAFEAGKNVIMEKPATSSIQEFYNLDALFTESNLHIYYAFHAAKAFEVTWFRNYYLNEKNRSDMGPITAFSSSFFDPYYQNGRINQRARRLDNSWIDSGVNALSVLNELMDIKTLELISSSKTRLNEQDVPIQAAVRFCFPVDGEGCAGMGIIDTNWALGLNKKKTYLAFTFSGYLIELDHSNQRVLLRSPDNNTSVLQDCSGRGDRLVNHYIGVFQDYLKCRQKNTFNNKEAREIHEKLFSADNWRDDS